MGKKIFIVSSSPRKNGNTDILADEFERGAKDAGNETERVNIRDLDLKFCIGCFYCFDHEGCVLQDGMNALYERIQNSDILAFATPVYYYEMSGQLKTFIDRLNPLYPRDNRFKEVYLLTASAEEDKSAMDGAIKGVQGFIDCHDGVKLAGVVYGVGANEVGEIRNTDAPKQAYEMGFSIK